MPSTMSLTDIIHFLNFTRPPVALPLPPKPSELEFSPLIRQSHILSAISHLLGVDDVSPVICSYQRASNSFAIYFSRHHEVRVEPSSAYYRNIRAVIALLFKHTKNLVGKIKSSDDKRLTEAVKLIMHGVVRRRKARIIDCFREVVSRAVDVGILETSKQVGERTSRAFEYDHTPRREFQIVCTSYLSLLHAITEEIGLENLPADVTVEEILEEHTMSLRNAIFQYDNGIKVPDDKIISLIHTAWVLAKHTNRYIEGKETVMMIRRMRHENMDQEMEELHDIFASTLMNLGRYQSSIRRIAHRLASDRHMHWIWRRGQIKILEVCASKAENQSSGGMHPLQLLNANARSNSLPQILEQEFEGYMNYWVRRLGPLKWQEAKEVPRIEISVRPHAISAMFALAACHTLKGQKDPRKVIVQLGISPPIAKTVSTNNPWCCTLCEVYLREWRRCFHKSLFVHRFKDDGDENKVGCGVPIDFVPLRHKFRFPPSEIPTDERFQKSFIQNLFNYFDPLDAGWQLPRNTPVEVANGVKRWLDAQMQRVNSRIRDYATLQMVEHFRALEGRMNHVTSPFLQSNGIDGENMLAGPTNVLFNGNQDTNELHTDDSNGQPNGPPNGQSIGQFMINGHPGSHSNEQHNGQPYEEPNGYQHRLEQLDMQLTEFLNGPPFGYINGRPYRNPIIKLNGYTIYGEEEPLSEEEQPPSHQASLGKRKRDITDVGEKRILRHPA